MGRHPLSTLGTWNNSSPSTQPNQPPNPLPAPPPTTTKHHPLPSLHPSLSSPHPILVHSLPSNPTQPWGSFSLSRHYFPPILRSASMIGHKGTNQAARYAPANQHFLGDKTKYYYSAGLGVLARLNIHQLSLRMCDRKSKYGRRMRVRKEGREGGREVNGEVGGGWKPIKLSASERERGRKGRWQRSMFLLFLLLLRPSLPIPFPPPPLHHQAFW